MNITRLLHININCSDFDRSRQFYELLGFEIFMPVEPNGTAEVAAAVGMQSYVVRGALMKHPSGTVIDLLEWQQPRDEDAPYERLNHLGIARVAFASSDIAADMRLLAAAGVEFLSDRASEVAGPSGTTIRFVCFRDPDGTVLELVDMGTPAD
jgi:catechol 2,3-dioxygenase-like lactoylglutathione lyase family enzyme